MKKIVSFLLCIILLLSVCTGFSGCGKENVLKFGVNPYFVPMTYEDDESGTCRGYVIDVMEEAVNRMGMKLETQICAVSQRYWFMSQGKNNCIWDVYQEDDFDYTWSDILFSSNIVCVVPAECEVKNVFFENTAIGIRNNSFEQQAQMLFFDRFSSCDIGGYNSYSKLFDELDQGIISTVIMEKLSAEYIVGKSGGKYKIMDESLCDCSYAVGFKLGNTELCEQFNTVLKEMRTDGTMKALQEKWFQKELSPKG